MTLAIARSCSPASEHMPLITAGDLAPARVRFPPNGYFSRYRKAEDSLVRRDLKTRLAVGRTGVSKTGSSTVRRSFAALLRDYLGLRVVPRNASKPCHCANFALEGEAEERLTDWMHATLTLAVWPKPDTIATVVSTPSDHDTSPIRNRFTQPRPTRSACA